MMSRSSPACCHFRSPVRTGRRRASEGEGQATAVGEAQPERFDHRPEDAATADIRVVGHDRHLQAADVGNGFGQRFPRCRSPESASRVVDGRDEPADHRCPATTSAPGSPSRNATRGRVEDAATIRVRAAVGPPFGEFLPLPGRLGPPLGDQFIDGAAARHPVRGESRLDFLEYLRVPRQLDRFPSCSMTTVSPGRSPSCFRRGRG